MISVVSLPHHGICGAGYAGGICGAGYAGGICGTDVWCRQLVTNLL